MFILSFPKFNENTIRTIRINPKVLEKFASNKVSVKKMSIILDCDDRTTRKYLKNNEVILTSIPVILLIQEETGATDKEMFLLKSGEVRKKSSRAGEKPAEVAQDTLSAKTKL